MDDSQYLPRIASGLLKSALLASPVVVLIGARQTGKSTLVRSAPFLGFAVASGHVPSISCHAAVAKEADGGIRR